MNKRDIVARLGVLEKSILDTLNLLQEIKTQVLDSIEDDAVDSGLVAASPCKHGRRYCEECHGNDYF